MYAENQALRFLADLAGLPAGAGGCFVPGGSAANLSALVGRARHRAPARRADRPARWRVAVSDQTHSSVANTMRIIDVDPLVVADRRRPPHRRRRSQAALDADADPASVCAVVATAGTTNAGLVDDLAGIARGVRATADIWMHVDAAYGGAALLAPSVRDRFRGIEHADSLVIDPHKWLFAPFDCAALLYREPGARPRGAHAGRVVPRRDPRRARRVEPVRLRVPPDPPRPRPAVLVLARGPRHRRVPRRDRDACSRPRTRAAARIRAHPHLELVREPELSIVLFRRTGWDRRRLRRAGRHDLLAEQIAFVTPTRWHGETVARLAFLHPETHARASSTRSSRHADADVDAGSARAPQTRGARRARRAPRRASRARARRSAG